MTVPADGSAAPTRLLTRANYQRPTAWSAEDEIVFQDLSTGNGDLRMVPADGGEVRTYLEADYREQNLAISPDGTLAAYESAETEDYEIYVRGYPEPVGKYRISVGGGRYAAWSPDGDELYFWRPSPGADSLFAVPVQRDPDFVPGEPEFLFAADVSSWSWDVHPDGRFLVAQNVGAAEPDSDGEVEEPRYLVVLNWFEELRERLGDGG